MIRLVVFFKVLEIFNNESVNSTFKNKLEYKGHRGISRVKMPFVNILMILYGYVDTIEI